MSRKPHAYQVQGMVTIRLGSLPTDEQMAVLNG